MRNRKTAFIKNYVFSTLRATSESNQFLLFRVFGKDRNRNLDFFLRDIVFFDGTCRSCSTQCGVLMNCPEDLDDIIEKVSCILR